MTQPQRPDIAAIRKRDNEGETALHDIRDLCDYIEHLEAKLAANLKGD